ncbi:MAG: c-type cytochrome [Nitrospiraceae bacterium]
MRRLGPRRTVRAIIVLLLLVIFWAGDSLGRHGLAATPEPGEKLVQSLCLSCHRLEGKPLPRSKKQAPDLIGAGSKYQSDWLERWLQDSDIKLYPLGYGDHPERRRRHLSLPSDQAKTVAAFFTTRNVARVSGGVMRPGTPEQLDRGAQVFKEQECHGCHLTPASTPRGYIGGMSSTSFIGISKRLQADWVFRFNQHPDDFEPESGMPKPTPPVSDEDLYALTAFMMTLR